MSATSDDQVLDALLDSWDRNNTILVNLLRALPDGALELAPAAGGWSIGQLFTHVHHPIPMLQHLIWHEGYHHGQIKLALTQAGEAFDDEAIGPAHLGRVDGEDAPDALIGPPGTTTSRRLAAPIRDLLPQGTVTTISSDADPMPAAFTARTRMK
jgi:hypothetical protein